VRACCSHNHTMRELGSVFQLRRTPSRSSTSLHWSLRASKSAMVCSVGGVGGIGGEWVKVVVAWWGGRPDTRRGRVALAEIRRGQLAVAIRQQDKLQEIHRRRGEFEPGALGLSIANGHLVYSVGPSAGLARQVKLCNPSHPLKSPPALRVFLQPPPALQTLLNGSSTASHGESCFRAARRPY
jgi:hypothetical protein